MKLTEVVVREAKPPNGTTKRGKPIKDIVLRDGEVTGFCCRVALSGAKSFFAEYQLSNGAKRRVGLGTWGTVTVAQARQGAKQTLGQVAAKRDPYSERKEAEQAARAAAAVRHLTVEKLIENWGELHLSRRSPAYRANATNRLKTALAKDLTKSAAEFMKAQAITALDVTRKKDGPSAAMNLWRAGRGCWNFAIARDDLKNPVNPWKVPAPAEPGVRDRVLSDEELAAIWHAAGVIGDPFGPIVRLLILTGQRRTEVSALPVAELDWGAGVWTLEAARAKNATPHRVPLAPPAAAIVTKAIEDRSADAMYVFQNAKGTAPSGFNHAKIALDREAAAALGRPLAPWVIHDLRRTVATGLRALGVGLEVTESILNHRSGTRAGIVAVYQRYSFDKEKREALDRWADHVLALAAASPPPEK